MQYRLFVCCPPSAGSRAHKNTITVDSDEIKAVFPVISNHTLIIKLIVMVSRFFQRCELIFLPTTFSLALSLPASIPGKKDQTLTVIFHDIRKFSIF